MPTTLDRTDRTFFLVDWTKAPSWAMYHTYDEVFSNSDKPTGHWWSHRPRIYYGKSFWELGDWPTSPQSADSHLHLPKNADWKLSLTARPRCDQ